MNLRCVLCNARQAILYEVDYPWVARAIRVWPGPATGPEHSQAIHGSATGTEQSALILGIALRCSGDLASCVPSPSRLLPNAFWALYRSRDSGVLVLSHRVAEAIGLSRGCWNHDPPKPQGPTTRLDRKHRKTKGQGARRGRDNYRRTSCNRRARCRALVVWRDGGER